MAFIPLWLAGALLSIIGSTFSNLGVNIQKYSAMKEELREDEFRGFWSQPIWVLGFSFVVFGSLFDFSALAFASQSVVAVVGSMTLVANIFFAHYWLKEHLSHRDIIGTFFIIAGAVVAILFGDRTEVDYTSAELKNKYIEPTFVVYVIATGGVAVLCYLFVLRAQPIREKIISGKKQHADLRSKRELDQLIDIEQQISRLNATYAKYEALHPIAYCYLAGFMGSLVLIFAKSIAELIRATANGENQFTNFWTYVFVGGMFACIFTETHFLATGLRFFDALFIVPVFQCCFILLGASAGGVFFGEFSRFSTTSAICFPVGVAITTFGVYVLSSRNSQDNNEDAIGQGYINNRKRGVSRSRASHTDGVTVNLDQDSSSDDMELGAINGDGPMKPESGSLAAKYVERHGNGEEQPPRTLRLKSNAERSQALARSRRKRAVWRMHDARSKLVASSAGSVIFTQFFGQFVKPAEMDARDKYERKFARAQHRRRSSSAAVLVGDTFRKRTNHAAPIANTASAPAFHRRAKSDLSPRTSDADMTELAQRPDRSVSNFDDLRGNHSRGDSFETENRSSRGTTVVVLSRPVSSPSSTRTSTAALLKDEAIAEIIEEEDAED